MVVDGFVQVFDLDNEVWRIPIDQIRQVIAWKDDLFGYDSVVVGLRIKNDPRFYRVFEEDEGSQAFFRWLGELTDGAWGALWRQVTFPAFEYNLTHIWGEGEERIGLAYECI